MAREEFEEAEPELPPVRALHIKKRALKNKALAVSFNEKDLRDFVTGFHKRKKKRRKEAQKIQEEALRRKKIELRKQRKLERELAFNGGALPAVEPADDENDENLDGDEDNEPIASVEGTTMYDNGEMQVTVTTREISREKEDDLNEEKHAAEPRLTGAVKKQSLSVSKTRTFKKVGKQKSRAKPQKKRDKKKGKKRTRSGS